MSRRSNTPWEQERDYASLEMKYLSRYYPLSPFAMWHYVVVREFLWVANYAKIARVLRTPRFRNFYERCRVVAISSQYGKLPINLQISALPKAQNQSFKQVLELLEENGDVNDEES